MSSMRCTLHLQMCICCEWTLSSPFITAGKDLIVCIALTYIQVYFSMYVHMYVCLYIQMYAYAPQSRKRERMIAFRMCENETIFYFSFFRQFCSFYLLVLFLQNFFMHLYMDTRLCMHAFILKRFENSAYYSYRM